MLLLLTNDNKLLEKLISPSLKLKKIYTVMLNEAISKNDVEIIKSGFIIDNKKISIEKVIKLENDNEVGIEINGDENKIFDNIIDKINLKIIK